MIILAAVAAAGNQIDCEAGDQAEEDEAGGNVVSAGDVKVGQHGTGVRKLRGGFVVEGEGVLAEDVVVLVEGDDETGVFTFGGVVVRHRQLYGDFAGFWVNIIAVNHNRDFVPFLVHKYRIAVFVIDLDLTVVKLIGGVDGDDGVAVLVGAVVVDDCGLVGEGDGIFVDGAADARGRGSENEVAVAVLTEVELKLVAAVGGFGGVSRQGDFGLLAIGIGANEGVLDLGGLAVLGDDGGSGIRSLVAIGRAQDGHAGIVGADRHHDVDIAAFGRSAGGRQTVGYGGHQPHEGQANQAQNLLFGFLHTLHSFFVFDC